MLTGLLLLPSLRATKGFSKIRVCVPSSWSPALGGSLGTGVPGGDRGSQVSLEGQSCIRPGFAVTRPPLGSSPPRAGGLGFPGAGELGVFVSLQVTELRGLATILVGVVTCDSINFFTTKPQAILVDITELGTIKLRLEVLWK